MMTTPKVIRTGASKSNAFTIAIVANPALEAPWKSGTFIRDPIIGGPEAAFDASVVYIDTALFGGLPAQAEQLLSDPAIGPFVRVVSLFDAALPPASQNSLVGQDPISNLLIARRTAFKPFLANYGVAADIVYAVSASETHTRASAWFTTDDDTGGGVPFTQDHNQFFHRFNNVIPGTIAIHVTAKSMTAVHEFQHAISSYSNGSIVDLYVDSPPAFNCKGGRPIPPVFGTYNPLTFNSDPVRDHLTYPPGWNSYHCELLAPSFPALMDNYWQSPSVPEVCQNDGITRKFVLDRLLTKIGRP